MNLFYSITTTMGQYFFFNILTHILSITFSCPLSIASMRTIIHKGKLCHNFYRSQFTERGFGFYWIWLCVHFEMLSIVN